jgi:hypothetical protein
MLIAQPHPQSSRFRRSGMKVKICISKELSDNANTITVDLGSHFENQVLGQKTEWQLSSLQILSLTIFSVPLHSPICTAGISLRA